MPVMMAVVGVSCMLLGGSLERSGSAAEPTLTDLAFLAGAWEADDEGRFMREVWDAPRGDAMVGHFSIVEDGRAVLYELFTVEQEEGALVLRLRHFGRGLEPWASEASGPLTLPLVEVGAARALFEDPERDFPRRVVYAVEQDTLTVRLEPSESSERDEIVIELRRAER